MAKKKHTNNTPRRKRYNRRDRLQNAKKWIDQYSGNHIAKGYSKWFGVDLLCAINELEMLGHKFKPFYKEQVKKSFEARQIQKQNRKRKEVEWEDVDEGFYFVAGYTENGAPYGITLEETEEDEETQPFIKSQNSLYHLDIDDDNLPF